MNTYFLIMIAAVFVTNTVLIGFMTWAVQSERFGKYRIRTPERNRIPIGKKYINVSLNMLLSLLLFVAAFYYLGDKLVYVGSTSVATLIGEVLASLMLYDFMYYFLHRGMHYPKVMKYVHGVHHYVRFPTSVESTYLHPLENIFGVSLLFIAVVILGPISTTAFAIMFFIYTSVNIIVHSNLVFPHPALRLLNFWAIKHDIHHGKHLNANYASIFPFWDQMFGTAK
ncbi:sterol desaturase family protein [Zhongshania sp.]|uniref:sterol desaturase family protein n=1 Tax=Zhongshania sp. TaxID=1971902 RepID=UPI001B7812FF|nr:sterol desaturase family protein [Zhongshania sp.]MBQ0795201.1 sterol desaturase family protein [Zhongshania sp.]